MIKMIAVIDAGNLKKKTYKLRKKNNNIRVTEVGWLIEYRIKIGR